MKKPTRARARTRSEFASPGRTAAASSLALAIFTANAYADPQASTPPAAAASDEPVEEVLVTGIRHAIAASIDVKREEMSIVEVVSAEEIGKLPDVSIGESIARLPGLAAQRVNGRAQSISIRGLAPDFTTTLLNGRQQASSGDNRAVEFDQYPSELLSSVVIYKTPDANISGFGLSGTADLRTVRPLDFRERTVSVNIRGELSEGGKMNDDVRNYGGRLSASYIDQNDDGTVGWAVGYAHLDSPSKNEHTKLYNFETFGDPSRQDLILPDAADNATFVTGQEIFATSRSNKRDAVIGILEFKPTDRLHTTVDLYYSKFDQTEVMRGAQWFSNVWADAQTFTGVGTEDLGGTQFAVSGQATGVAPIIRNDLNTRTDELVAAGINQVFQINDDWALKADLSYSRNERDESITETYAGYGTGADAATQNDNRIFDTLGWDFAGKVPSWVSGLNYADSSQMSLGDRAPWGGWGHDGQTKEPHVKESITAAELGVERKFEDGFFRAVDLGVNFTKRDKDKRVDEFDLNLRDGRSQTLVAASDLVDSTSLGYAGFGDVLSVNLRSAIPRYYDRVVFINGDTYNKAWDLSEDVTTAHLRTTFRVGDHWSGNIGVQYVRQKQESTGSRINTTITPTQVDEVTDGATYSDILPSLNLAYMLTDNQKLRLAVAKVMARPRMDEMRATWTPGFGNPCVGGQPCVPGQTINPWSASGGNPQLEPWRATAFDLSYEWYISRASYVSLAGWYKDLKSYIYTQRLPFDFSGLPIPPDQAAQIPPGVIVSPIGQIDQPANGKGGWIKGFELSGSIELGKVADVLDGFGFQGSFSRTLSNLRPVSSDFADPDQVRATRIAGLSGRVYNLTAYYEKFGFQARASYRYRSAFKGEVVQLFAVRGVTEILADKQLDAQIGYSFPDGSRLENLSILLQVNNVTDSPYRTRLGTDGGGPRTEDGAFLPETYETYGRQILFGASYRF